MLMIAESFWQAALRGGLASISSSVQGSRKRQFCSARYRFLLAAVVFGVGRAASGVFENQGATVVQLDFGYLPCWALIAY